MHLQRGFGPLIIILLLGVFAFGFVSFPFINKALPTISAPLSTPISSRTPVSLPKRYFDTGSFFGDKSYPDELLKLPTDKLVGFVCEGRYDRSGESIAFTQNGLPYSESGELSRIGLTDDELLKFLSKKESEAQKINARSYITFVQKCITEKDVTLVHYGVTPGMGGAGSASHFEYQAKQSAIEMENAPYFTCDKVLAVTNDDKLYVTCGGGDGGFGSASIYRVNMSNGTSQKLIVCTSEASVEGSNVKCE
jgi:hypothetical protein